MDASLSAYWVKFFKSAGFSPDIAAKHALIFSNNHIKPDMLPDLDKPSLREMGITLMGDMIAILRYAKKVIEVTSCEKFLVDTEDEKRPSIQENASRGARKEPEKKIILAKAISTKVEPKIVSRTNLIKKKIAPISKVVLKTSAVKRVAKKDIFEKETEDSDQESKDPKWTVKRQKTEEKKTVVGTQQNFGTKKVIKQRRTVFDRLGDSSVTSTTSNETNPTIFNVTGLDSDLMKNPSSVFNRLGGKDASIQNDKMVSGALKNGASDKTPPTLPPGILKKRSPLETKKIVTKSTGTMHADHEANSKNISKLNVGVKKNIRAVKSIQIVKQQPVNKKFIEVVRKIENPTSRLASERADSLPAKARLGLGKSSPTKRVAFEQTDSNRTGVFSRLGF